MLLLLRMLLLCMLLVVPSQLAMPRWLLPQLRLLPEEEVALISTSGVQAAVAHAALRLLLRCLAHLNGSLRRQFNARYQLVGRWPCSADALQVCLARRQRALCLGRLGTGGCIAMAGPTAWEEGKLIGRRKAAWEGTAVRVCDSVEALGAWPVSWALQHTRKHAILQGKHECTRGSPYRPTQGGFWSWQAGSSLAPGLPSGSEGTGQVCTRVFAAAGSRLGIRPLPPPPVLLALLPWQRWCRPGHWKGCALPLNSQLGQLCGVALCLPRVDGGMLGGGSGQPSWLSGHPSFQHCRLPRLGEKWDF